MKTFDLFDYTAQITLLEYVVTTYADRAATNPGFKDQQQHDRVLKMIQKWQFYALTHGMDDLARNLVASETHLRINDTNATVSTLAADLRHCKDVIMEAVEKRGWLRVDTGRRKYVDNERLFGEPVYEAFKSARPDIKDAGNCLAADCNTAAVFHLMRAVEWGLRALCVKFGFRKLKTHRKGGTVKMQPVEFSEWEGILTGLKERMDKRCDKLKKGPAKQLYQEFYYPLWHEIRAFRDAWRNHVMHTRREYTAADADAILDHVNRFFVLLSSRVSET